MLSVAETRRVSGIRLKAFRHSFFARTNDLGQYMYGKRDVHLPMQLPIERLYQLRQNGKFHNVVPDSSDRVLIRCCSPRLKPRNRISDSRLRIKKYRRRVRPFALRLTDQYLQHRNWVDLQTAGCLSSGFSETQGLFRR